MAQKKQVRRNSLISRLRAKLRRSQQQLKKTKTSRMAYGRRSFRSRFRSPFRRSNRGYSRPRRSGGFSNRMPIVGIRIPNILIWCAIIGGALFFGKDTIKPLIEKLKNKA